MLNIPVEISKKPPVQATDKTTDAPPPGPRTEGDDEGPLHRLPRAACGDGMPLAAQFGVGLVRPELEPMAYDHAAFVQLLHHWLGENAPAAAAPADDDGPAPAPPPGLWQELLSAACAALPIGLAHGAEMALFALSSHPVVRLCAVSHPYVLGTFVEGFLKRMAGIPDPDPDNRTGIRYREKVVAAIANWNYVQGALDTLPASPLLRALKLLATAGISGVRDAVERYNTRAQLAALPDGSPAGPRKLTDLETLFVNCLMCWLRNSGVDLLRQSARTQAPPALDTVAERFLRTVMLGPQTPGGLPAAAISVQPIFSSALRRRDEALPAPEERHPGYAVNNLFQ